MRRVEKSTSPIADVGILLGRQGENEASYIAFDLTWLIDAFGDGTPVLVHQRQKDTAPYICSTTRTGSELSWVVTNTDTAYDGWGQAELRWTVGGTLAKTLIYKTIVVRSITAGTTIPDPYESWYDQMLAYIDNNTVTRYKRPFRFIQISDTHYGSQQYYHLLCQERMNRMVDWIVEEHKKHPLDFVIHTGDISYSNLYTDGETDYISKFYKEFISKIPCPIYSLPGNHDGYTETQFKKATGTPRQYTVEFGDIVLVMLDTFALPQSKNSGGSYIGGNAEYLQSVLDIDKNKDKKFILFAHYFYRDSDSAAFKDLVEDDRILYLVQGHTHQYNVSTYGTKQLVTGGNIAFWMNNGVKDTNFDAGHAWGYVLHELTENGISVKHIQPEGIYYYNGSSTDPINFPGSESASSIVANGNIEQTYDFSVEHDRVNNNYYCGLQKHDSVYTLTDSIALDWGVDLNEIFDVGVYGSESSAKSQTISNTPVTGSGFKLIVERVTNDISTGTSFMYLRQVIYPNNVNMYCLFRRYVPSTGEVPGWTEWNRVLTLNDKELVATGDGTVTLGFGG